MTVPDTTARPEVRLVLIPFDALEALLAGDLDRASALIGMPLPPFFLTQDRVWRNFHDRIRRDPASAPWLVRAVLAEPAAIVVGHAGFHGPPDEAGMVEIGYTILPEHRRKGYGRAVVDALLREAAATPDVRWIRARISPDNVASLALVRSCGFQRVGERQDAKGAFDLVFERPARAQPYSAQQVNAITRAPKSSP